MVLRLQLPTSSRLFFHYYGRRVHAFSSLQNHTLLLSSRDKNDTDKMPPPPPPSSRRRAYHTTTRTEILPLIGAVVVGGLGYVAYQTYRGQNVMPKDAEQAQKVFREQQAQREGLKSPPTKKDESMNKNNINKEKK